VREKGEKCEERRGGMKSNSSLSMSCAGEGGEKGAVEKYRKTEDPSFI